MAHADGAVDDEDEEDEDEMEDEGYIYDDDYPGKSSAR